MGYSYNKVAGFGITGIGRLMIAKGLLERLLARFAHSIPSVGGPVGAFIYLPRSLSRTGIPPYIYRGPLYYSYPWRNRISEIPRRLIGWDYSWGLLEVVGRGGGGGWGRGGWQMLCENAEDKLVG